MTGCSEGITAHKCKLTKTVATTGQCLPQHVLSEATNGRVPSSGLRILLFPLCFIILLSCERDIFAK